MGLLLLNWKEALWLTGYRQHNGKRKMLLIEDSCHKAPYASEQPACSESPLQLSVPCPYFLTSHTHKSSLHLLADSPFCTLQALHLPSLETKEEPGSSNRDINGLMDRGAYMSRARSWSNTSRVWQMVGRTWQQGKREITSYRGIGSVVARETTRGEHPSPPLR